MAGEDRTQAQHLTYFADAAAQAKKYGLFSLIRGAEARAAHLPRVGQAKMPSRNVVDLAQTPSMGFAQSTLVDIHQQAGRTKVSGYWLGLTGTMGPLPTHLTEFAFYERRYGTSQPFGDWLDMIAGRMLQLFYRSWADSQPAAMADRPGDDRFVDYLGALSGALEGARSDGAFPPHLRTHYAAVFGGSRSAVAIEDALGHLLGQKVHLLEFQSRWCEFEEQDYSRLGVGFSTLGDDAMLGHRIRSASDAFRVVIRAANLRDYKSLMPGGKRFAIAAEALDAFKPSHLEWDICVELDDAEAPALKLDGSAQLGWISWAKDRKVKRVPGELIRADAHLTKRKRKPKGARK